jgi:hypothetical protein
MTSEELIQHLKATGKIRKDSKVTITATAGKNPRQKCSTCQVPLSEHESANHPFTDGGCLNCGRLPIKHSPEEGRICHEAIEKDRALNRRP